MKKKILRNTNIKAWQGFAMMEVLIAVVILLVGILGLLGLQAQGLKNNHSAYLKSQVVSLIDDMADRMRANKTGLDSNRYASIDTSSLSSDPGYDCITDYTGTSNGSSCNEDEIATYDIYAWGKTLASLLPSGYGKVVCNDSPCVSGSTHTITVLWDDRRTGSADTEFSVVFAL
ncbi:MAG: type IV pilus modification protein PilV [Methylococcaceae bacterium]